MSEKPGGFLGLSYSYPFWFTAPSSARTCPGWSLRWPYRRPLRPRLQRRRFLAIRLPLYRIKDDGSVWGCLFLNSLSISLWSSYSFCDLNTVTFVWFMEDWRLDLLEELVFPATFCWFWLMYMFSLQTRWSVGSLMVTNNIANVLLLQDKFFPLISFGGYICLCLVN